MIISIYSFNYLNVLEVKCCPNKGNDFIVHFMIYMFNMNATMQAFTKITGLIDPMSLNSLAVGLLLSISIVL